MRRIFIEEIYMHIIIEYLLSPENTIHKRTQRTQPPLPTRLTTLRGHGFRQVFKASDNPGVLSLSRFKNLR